MTTVVAIMSMSLDGYVADANDGVAISSPTASKTPLLERNRLPARSPCWCTAPRRSSSARRSDPVTLTPRKETVRRSAQRSHQTH